MSEKIKVRIKAELKMQYDQTVEVTKEEWEKLKQTPERDMECNAMSPLGDLLDLRDVCGWDDWEEPELEVVGDDNYPVEPPDYYCPG